MAAVKELYREANAELSEANQLILPVIIFVTSYVSNETFRVFCKEKGADYVFEKPLQDNQLL